MSNIDKIRQEIERRKKICEDIFERESDTYYQGKAVAYEELLPFIDSLPDEHLRDSTKMISEDERIRKWMVELVESQMPKTFIEVKKQDVFAWLERQKEQKSAKCIEDSIEFKEGFKTGRETGLHDGQKYVLDNLEDYGLCKSAEWSEEDEDKVIQYLHDRDGGMLWSKATDITRDILDMLRPSWKPSENQMSMLLAVVNDPNNAGSESCHLSLKSLYNDLKKL